VPEEHATFDVMMDMGVEEHGEAMGKKPSTYADLEALPDDVVGELIDGELYASPRPALPHGGASFRLASRLGDPFEQGRGGPGGWTFAFEPELHLGEDVLVPDLAGWRQERMPELPDTAAATLAPNWVCEVLSPSTRALDQGPKLAVYAREGVGHVWWVDPKARSLQVLRLEGSGYKFLGLNMGAARVRAEPFEALEWELDFLWGRRAGPRRHERWAWPGAESP
jgi:Uma2 family endonuclease